MSDIKPYKTTPEWQEFEKLVARIEKALAPQGAVVTCPDRIKDLVTGYPREVDVSIRIPDGDSTRLITVECRKRNAKPDDTWIEQLITKREKIGAWRTIAVSSKGFSRSAAITASHYGIELRRIDEITDAEILQLWAGGTKVTMLTTGYSLLGFALLGEDGTTITTDQLLVDFEKLSDSDAASFSLFKNKTNGETASITDLADLVPSPSGLMEESDPIQAVCTWDAKPNSWYVETHNGEKAISRILLKMEFWKTATPAPIQSLKQYVRDDQAVLQLAKWEAVTEDDHAVSIETTGIFGGYLPPKKNLKKAISKATRPARKVKK